MAIDIVASIIGVSLHGLPAARVMMGGRVASSVRVDIVTSQIVAVRW